MTQADARVRGLDEGRVSRWLAEHAGLRAPLRFERIGDGQSNMTFAVTDADGARAVLRRPPLGAVLESAHDIEREHRIIAGLGAVGMPVPATLGVCTDATVTGAPFLAMERVEGHVLLTSAAAAALAPPARRAAGLGLARTLVELQRADLQAAGLADLVRRTPYAARQLRRWQGQWEESRTRELPLVDELAERLAAALPPEQEQVMIHGDFRLDNVVYRVDGSVAAVLDWELASAGHPLADLGLAVAYWEEVACGAEGLFKDPVTTLEGFPAVAEIVDLYGELSGRDVDGVELFVAFAFWKIAIIVEGVHRRWLNDPANGAATASRVGVSVPRLVRSADRWARRAGA